MMHRTKWIVGVCIAATTISFLATLAAQPKGEVPAGDLATLNISAEEWSDIRQSDPTFEAESAALSKTLTQERTRLADLLDDPDSSDEVISAQVETVIGSHDRLERRVAVHLLKIRHQLSAAQQKQLMGLVSDTVRHGGFRWRGGRSADASPTTDETTHPGRKRQGRDK